MNILFYTVANKRSRDIESQAMEFAKDGHSIFLFTQTPRSELHDFFEANGWSTQSGKTISSRFPILLLRQMIDLLLFCRKSRIDIILSHLDPCNLVSVCSQYFIQGRVIVNRHHGDALTYEASAKTQKISRWIYRKAKYCVVVSEGVKKYMIAEEGVNAMRVTAIPLSYDFDLYTLPDQKRITEIKSENSSEVLLCTVGRLIALKRISLVIKMVERLVNSGVDVRLMILGRGPEENNLKSEVESKGLLNRVNFIGFTSDVLSYMAAADYYVHLSVSEASCTTVKEAGLVNMPVIVCNDVGDFNEYIQHERNGFVVSKEHALEEAYQIILQTYKDKALLRNIGSGLRKTVMDRFDIKRTISLFYDLFKRILN